MDNQPPILPPGIADLTPRDRAKERRFQSAGFRTVSRPNSAPKDSLRSPYIDRVLGQVGKGDMFRNMGGLAEAVGLAEKLSAISGEGAEQQPAIAPSIYRRRCSIPLSRSSIAMSAAKLPSPSSLLPGAGSLPC